MLTTAREINVFVTGPQDPVSWGGKEITQLYIFMLCQAKRYVIESYKVKCH